MIAFFPKPYEDELMYSWICRYHTQSGYKHYLATCDDVFAKRTVHPSFEFVNEYSDDCMAWITRYDTFENIVLDHTMLKSYIRFSPKLKRKTAFDSMINMLGSYKTVFNIPNIGERRLKYCPICAQEDRRKYGEAYWHREHQIIGNNICPAHRCYLEESNIVTHSKVTPNFYDAESEISYGCDGRICNNERAVALTQYVIDVFRQPLDLESEYPIGLFLQDKLKSTYIAESGLKKNATTFYEDYCCFYKDILEPMDFSRMQKIFNGYRYDQSEILQIGFLEEISPYDITHLPLDYEIKGLDKLYKDLSEKYSLDTKIVKEIGDSALRYSRKSTYIQRKSGPQRMNWERLDDERLSEVTSFVDAYMKCPGKPKKLAVATVMKGLGYNPKQIVNLPKCKAYIETHMEDYHHYWARCIEWAVKELELSNDVISVGRVCDKLNIRRIDFIRSCSLIKDSHIKEIVDALN